MTRESLIDNEMSFSDMTFFLLNTAHNVRQGRTIFCYIPTDDELLSGNIDCEFRISGLRGQNFMGALDEK